jgi:hypothetical protein
MYVLFIDLVQYCYICGHVKSYLSVYQKVHIVASQVWEYHPSEGQTVRH